ncbi:MAG: Rha family transcriptional regulator [Roseburia sp.]|nr:Rha family transcriptional regulator [Roseburia sp.]
MKNLQTMEQTLDSREVAEMVEKDHAMLLRDLRRYIKQFNECNLAVVDFFRESTYKDTKGEMRPCYHITKKGCEFIAHKLIGTKGTVFTAKYINRFHEMQDIILRHESEPKLPWFIKKFRGKYIMLWRDFTEITGFDIESHKPRNWEQIIPGLDYNGWGWKCNNDEFKKEYGFDYGIDSCMMYFYPSGVIKVLRLISQEKGVYLKPEVYELITEEICAVSKLEKWKLIPQSSYSGVMLNEKAEDLLVTIKDLSVRINMILG